MPLGKVPVLEVDGKVYHQADAICRYLAKKFGLAGSNDEESLRMDIVVATLHDLMAELRKARSIQDEKEIAAKENKSCAEIFSYYTSKLEAIVKANGGYFVNGKLSWADIQFASGSENATRMLGADVLEQYPLLKSLKKTVLEEPNIKAWLCRREPVG